MILEARCSSRLGDRLETRQAWSAEDAGSVSLDGLFACVGATAVFFRLGHNLFVLEPQACQVDDVEVSVELAHCAELVSEDAARPVNTVLAPMKTATLLGLVFNGLQLGNGRPIGERWLFRGGYRSHSLVVAVSIPTAGSIPALLGLEPVSAELFLRRERRGV